jgi:type IV secretory pathway VirB4 component
MPIAKPTQEFVPISEIRDGVVVLRDGGLRIVLMVSSVNFALKSEDNQQAILLQFQNFLNTLDFAVQIVVHSRRFDVRPYLALLEERVKKQESELLQIQTREYIGFVRSFTESTAIMSKSFFIVVPYSPTPVKLRGGLPVGIRSKSAAPAAVAADFNESRTQLEQRIAVVEQGLTRCGLRTARLGTDEEIELFYKLFNPGEEQKPASYGTA